MIEKWRQSLDQEIADGSLLTELPHGLIIVKLYGYQLDMPSLKVINSYLSKRRQRIKTNDVYFWDNSGLHSWSIIIQHIYM